MFRAHGLNQYSYLILQTKYLRARASELEEIQVSAEQARAADNISEKTLVVLTATVKSDTNCVNADEVLPAKSGLLELNTATTEWLPALNEFVEYFAVPFERFTDAAAVLLPSK